MAATSSTLTQTTQLPVTVICINQGTEEYLPDMIDSIRLAPYLPKELIILDNGVTEQSTTILAQYEQLPYLRILSLEHPLPYAEALNKAIHAASGTCIVRIEPTDYIDEQRLWEQYEYLRTHPDVSVVGSNVMYFEHNTGKLIIDSNFPIGTKSIRRRFYHGQTGIQHATVMVRKSVMVQYPYHVSAHPAEEYEVFARMVRDGHVFENLRPPLTFKRLLKGLPREYTFQRIQKNFTIRDQLFGTHSSRWEIMQYFFHLHAYRKYLFERNSLLRYVYLVVAALFQPRKMVRRIVGWGRSPK
ncbi:glycosyltransferase family 2 protein [Pontibacter sp. G13]|uniref:glycosyltransferase family 2 protein n=1 Tax=Pontibacter sp. G13 TaxID=3074898 RepID=UPI00288A8BC9|nr:glycosyltransferase family 2 protein [Pontibacter sp. G13]WNJ16878.1 glycosyltransferase family 2 protein [Pontibacter sp. G13]